MAPYTSFIDKPVGSDAFYFSTFKLNRILAEANVFISIPKMKQHRAAGITHSMKNLIGITPRTFYELPGQTGWRTKLHFHVKGGDINTNLPRSICDLNMVRPIHLAVIDGVKNCRGGEVPYRGGILI